MTIAVPVPNIMTLILKWLLKSLQNILKWLQSSLNIFKKQSWIHWKIFEMTLERLRLNFSENILNLLLPYEVNTLTRLHVVYGYYEFSWNRYLAGSYWNPRYLQILHKFLHKFVQNISLILYAWKIN